MIDVAIVGAGISGLALGAALEAEGRQVVVLDARDRPGGRVLSELGYDLGPAWIWPHNRRMLALTDALGLRRFPQHSFGRMVFEDGAGTIRRDLDMATMGGALRIDGGIAGVTDALAEKLSDLRLNYTLRRVEEDAEGVTLIGDGFEKRAHRVVMALPPRLAAGLGVQCRDVPTWMAGQAKVVVRYETPFWREAGLNGDAISHRGPLMEIHDASPMDASEGGLFGFAVAGAAQHPEFRRLVLAQLSRLFGDRAAAPLGVLVKDWRDDPFTATTLDHAEPGPHAAYPPQSNTARVIFAGSEAAREDGGFLEGALVAADAAHRALARAVA